MRFRINHPQQARTWAWYGWDEHLDWWVEVRVQGRLIDTLDALTSPDGSTSIQAVLDLLVDHHFIDRDSLHEAMGLLPHMDAANIEDPDVQRAAQAITNIRTAASRG